MAEFVYEIHIALCAFLAGGNFERARWYRQHNQFRQPICTALGWALSVCAGLLILAGLL